MKALKTLFLSLIAASTVMMTACDPQEASGPDIGPAPQSDAVTFSAQPNTDNPNIVTFTNTSEGFKALWDLGNGQTAEGNEVEGQYPLKGDYTVTLTIFTKSGQAANSQTITIAEDNTLMLDDPDLNMLTGGQSAAEGKTWVLDSTQFGHLGVGPTDTFSPDWWAAAALDKSGKGIYDDEFTFKLDGLTFEQVTHGDVYVNGAHVDEFPNAVQEDGGGDYIAPFDGGTNYQFSLNKADDGSMTLKVSGGGFIGYYTGATTYDVLALGDNELYIRNIDGAGGLAWYQRLIPKGYQHPVVVPPLKSEALSDDFDTDGNFTWSTDQITEFNESYDNPATFGINTSTKVAKYVKGDGPAHEYDNVYIDLGYKLDLTQRNKFSLKVYMPSYNDYTTTGGESWNPDPRLLQQVSVKLQDASLGGDAYTTQEERIQHVGADSLDQWVELTFDFSDVTDRQDFSKVVVQIGGEAHFNPGTFFIDDFKLLDPQ